MTDTPHSDPAAASVSQAISTAAEAFARLEDMPLLEAMVTQRALRSVLPDRLERAELGVRRR